MWSEWTNTQKVNFTDTNSALKAKSSKKTLQDLKISLSLFFRLGVTIKDIQQERAWLKNDIFSVQDTVVVETRDSEHAQEMVTELKKNFENLCVTGLNLSGNHS